MTWPIRDFARPKGIEEADVDAFTGLKPGPFTSKTVREVFIDGTQPTQGLHQGRHADREGRPATRWQDGCIGTPVTKGFLDLSKASRRVPRLAEAEPAAGSPAPGGAPASAAASTARPDGLLLQPGQLPPVRPVLGCAVPAHRRMLHPSAAPTPSRPSPTGADAATPDAADPPSRLRRRPSRPEADPLRPSPPDRPADRTASGPPARIRTSTIRSVAAFAALAGRHSLTSGWLLEHARARHRACAPVPWPWMTVTRGAPARLAWSR